MCWIVIFCGVLCDGQAPASPGTVSPSADTMRVSSRLVTVDVVVTENRRAVKGLGKDSFHILENGKEQEIKTFEERSQETDQSTAELRVSLPLHVYSNDLAYHGPVNLLLLDALNTPIQDQQYLRKQMLAYLKELPTGMRVAIFTLGFRLRMIQGLTSDVSQLVAAMESRKAGSKSSALLDQQEDTATPMDGSSNERALDVLDQFQAENTAIRYDLRIQTTLDAMKQLGAFLGGVAGRKNIIWLSGSFPLALQPDESADNPFISQRNYSAQLQRISDMFNADRIAVYPVDVRGVLPSNIFDSASSSVGSSGAPSRRATRPGANSLARAQSQFSNQLSAEHATMQVLAEETGGHAFYDTNALKQAITDALEDGTHYYTLTYSPENKDFNGKFRKIEVKAEKKYHLAYRRGYYALPIKAHEGKGSYSLISPNDPSIQRGAPPAVQILFKARVLAAGDPLLGDFHPQPGIAGMASLKQPALRYCIDYSINVPDIAAELGPDRLYHSNLEILAIAYDPEGKPLNLIDHPFRFNVPPEEYEKLRRDRLTLHEEIDIPPGEVYLRLVVHDLATHRVGSLEVPIKEELLNKEKASGN
jgi:VWFA-related protein